MKRVLMVCAALLVSSVSFDRIALADGGNRLKYFGYCAYYYMSAINDHVNVAWIGETSVAEIKKLIAEADCRNMRAILDVSYLLFNKDIGNYTLKANWRDNIKNYIDSLGPSLYNVIAFYPIDEPYRKAEDAKVADMVYQVTQELHRLAPKQAVLGIYNNAPKKICSYSGGEDGEPVTMTCRITNMPGFSFFDWVGIDCYSDGRFACTGYADWLPYPQAISWLKEFLRPDQRIVLVPQGAIGATAQWLSGGGEQLRTTEELNAIADALSTEIDKFVNLANSDPQIVGILTYMYQDNGNPQNFSYGVKDFPVLKSKFTSIGKSVISSPGLAATGCRTATVLVDRLFE